ncbi:hypothetical protein [Duganella sp. FT27W]|uniref:hypothetical protein n=1 Tax=Duganella sp. FT27W TaxID=2654636 RepID=UPI00128AEEA8|nr:hypothetical protein [Duganella sp. FT27W]MPQ56270.1 hypothetical protein [Duganella sp. FT27W]
MQLNTFPCVVEALHTTGVNIVRCAALGTTDVYVTDDFGHLIHRNMGHLASVQHSMNSADA